MTDADYEKQRDELLKKIEASTNAVSSDNKSTESWWSTENAMTMSGTVLLFGTLICVICAILLARGGNADTILRTFGTILIIISSLFLVVAGYSDQQIAPVMGLLGTIAGYLLGKSSEKKSPDKPE